MEKKEKERNMRQQEVHERQRRRRQESYSVSDGWTVLMRAAHGNRIDFAHVLLQKGVDVDKRNHLGQTALHWAYFNGLLRMLVQNGASSDIKNDVNRTPIDYVPRSNYEEAVGLLQQHQVSTYNKLTITCSSFKLYSLG